MYSELQSMVQNIIKNSHLTDVRIGTVLSLVPLKIGLGDNKTITQFGDNILLAESVIRKTATLTHTHNLTGLAHSHSTAYGASGTALGDTYTTKPNSETVTITITQGLAAGDKILMIMAAGGQQWVVISKLRDTTNISVNDWS